MKNIPNLQLSIVSEKNLPYTAKGLLSLCLNNTPPGGFDLATMRARNRVADAIEKVEEGGTINLEDADFAAAQDAVRQMKWSGMHKDIVKFAELFGV